jgi:hypothetical protein
VSYGAKRGRKGSVYGFITSTRTSAGVSRTAVKQLVVPAAAAAAYLHRQRALAMSRRSMTYNSTGRSVPPALYVELGKGSRTAVKRRTASTAAAVGRALLCDIQARPREAKLGLAAVEKRKRGRGGSRDSYRAAQLAIRENRDWMRWISYEERERDGDSDSDGGRRKGGVRLTGWTHTSVE